MGKEEEKTLQNSRPQHDVCEVSPCSIASMFMSLLQPHLSFVRYNLKLPGAGNCTQINIASPLCTIRVFCKEGPDEILRGLLFLSPNTNSKTLHFHQGTPKCFGNSNEPLAPPGM